ncbi:unnamed protein product [Owenia fusiformis]|uniref:Pyrrolo-quinoline quinone repeat domain-containing protein n=1 Tax=Owenia fusiformis TaxID=6347 RepID=A0A8S4Q312_OWEFU|nr:unnamed protein product [Owenia fusiformis]
MGKWANTCRGVATWVDPLKPRGALCKRSIYIPTLDLRLLAVDAANGKNCGDFGVEGFADLRVATPNVNCVWYLNPPAVVRDVLIFGQIITDDDCGDNAPKGSIPAFNARTGQFMWNFMIVPTDPSDPAMGTYRDGTDDVGAGNAWAPISGDNELGFVYVPTSSPNPDHFGTNRIGDNHYCNSVVALNVSDGKVVWFRQLIHHDIFSYGLNVQPVVGSISRNGKERKVVLQGTKMGFLYVLDATNGEPVFDIQEQNVPTFTDLPGEIPSPTQPFPVDDFLKLAKISVDLRPGKDLWGRTNVQEQVCADFINSSGLDPFGEIFTPALVSKPIWWIPGLTGGMNIGGSVALDPTRSIAVAATQNDLWIKQLIPRNTSSPLPQWCKLLFKTPNADVPLQCYGFTLFKEKCDKPPWAMLHAVDLQNGRKLWSIPHGTNPNIPESTEEEGSRWYTGGILVTRGGLVIAGNTEDRYLRAFNIETGEQLYRSPDPMIAAAAGNPISYRTSGRQYVVLTVGGNSFLGRSANHSRSDHVYAFALP